MVEERRMRVCTCVYVHTGQECGVCVHLDGQLDVHLQVVPHEAEVDIQETKW